MRLKPLDFLMLACLVTLLLVGCFKSADPVPSYEYGPPADVPTLDYEAFNGLDPQTVQTMEERERNDELTWRVERLERQVSDLNAIVHRTGQSGLGDLPLTPTFEPETLLE